jgi:hypothetical protein
MQTADGASRLTMRCWCLLACDRDSAESDQGTGRQVAMGATVTKRSLPPNKTLIRINGHQCALLGSL